MYETLLTNEECANAIDMGDFYRVPCDKRDLNYDKYFKEGNRERTKLSEFNSNNTHLLDVEQGEVVFHHITYHALVLPAHIGGKLTHKLLVAE